MALHRQIAAFGVIGLVLFGAAMAGCGGNSDEPPPPPDYAKALSGSPAPLAALHKQANELLPGGKAAFYQRLEDLKGYPVVVNVWASWCGPCRAEFPHFQQATVKFGKEVAFLGVNSQDDNELATNFLADFPVPYPSYLDPDGEIKDDLRVDHGLPATFFYDAKGEMNYVRHGQILTQEELDGYIQKYAVEGQSN